jgi:Ca2+-binding EF-hand superfamily protein
MLPQMKLELISYEKNLDDLRRLFKEFDLDQSNYLNKDELRAALMKLNIILSDVQLEDLMQQIDIDNN